MSFRPFISPFKACRSIIRLFSLNTIERAFLASDPRINSVYSCLLETKNSAQSPALRQSCEETELRLFATAVEGGDAIEAAKIELAEQLQTMKYQKEPEAILALFKLAMKCDGPINGILRTVTENFLRNFDPSALKPTSEFLAILRTFLAEKKFEARTDPLRRYQLDFLLLQLDPASLLAEFFEDLCAAMPCAISTDSEMFFMVFRDFWGICEDLSGHPSMIGLKARLSRQADAALTTLASLPPPPPEAAEAALDGLAALAAPTRRSESLKLIEKLTEGIELSPKTTKGLGNYKRMLKVLGRLGACPSWLAERYPPEDILDSPATIDDRLFVAKMLLYAGFEDKEGGFYEALIRDLAFQRSELQIRLNESGSCAKTAHYVFEWWSRDPKLSSLMVSMLNSEVKVLRARCFNEACGTVLGGVKRLPEECWEFPYDCLRPPGLNRGRKFLILPHSSNKVGLSHSHRSNKEHPLESFLSGVLKHITLTKLSKFDPVFETQKQICLFNVDYYLHLRAPNTIIALELFGSEYMNEQGELTGPKAKKFEFLERIGVVVVLLEIDKVFYQMFKSNLFDEAVEIVAFALQEKLASKGISME